MRLLTYLPLLAVSAAMAEEALNLASAEQYSMQLSFAPPPIITPQTDFLQPQELQFDYLPAWSHVGVAQDVAGNIERPFHAAASVSPHGNTQRMLYRQRGANAYVVAQAYRQELKDYQDGDGNSVNAGYKRDGQMLMFGFVPDSNQEYRLGAIRDNIRDDKQPQHNIDALDTRRRVFTAGARIGAQDQSNTFNFNIRHVDLARSASNFDLRTPANPNQRIKMEIDRQRLFLDADYRLQYDEHRSQFGLKYEHDEHQAERFLINPMGAALRNAFRFPDVHSERFHIFYDHIWQIAPEHRLSAGISYDHLTADPRARNTATATPAPNNVWFMHYGKRVDDKLTTDGVGVAVAYEFAPNEQHKYRIALDSLIRQPNNTERFHALVGQNGLGWIGNPFLEPERHNRLSLSGQWQGSAWRDYGKIAGGDAAEAWQIKASIDYDKVNNFITLDRIRRPAMPLNGNIISRNVDATLIGAELEAAKSFSHNLAARAKIRYQYGENDSDKRPLYNVRPLTTDVALDWRDYTAFGSYNLGANLHYAHKSKRLDSNRATGLGFDNPKHYQSYAAVNLYGGLQWNDRFALSAGVNNLFDRQYYAFNEQPHVAAQRPIAVAAPERTFWLGFNFNF